MRIIALLTSLTLVASCGEAATSADQAAQGGGEATDQGQVRISAPLSGTLYFNYAAPLEAPRSVALDLAAKRYRVVSDGIHPTARDGALAYVNFCSPLAVQLAVDDADGFMTPLSDCVDRDTFTENSLQGPAISPDGKRVAILNHELYAEPEPSQDDPLGIRALVGREQYAATQIYDMNGALLEEYKHFGPAVWAKNGDLILAGLGGDVGYGIYRAAGEGAPVRIDDGRLRGPIRAIDAHPTRNRVAFLFNGQLYDMALGDGKPKRLHSHGHLLAGLAYSPDGEQIAIISEDTLQEALEMGGRGYPIFVFDEGDIHSIRLPFVVSGSLDWEP